MSIYFLPQKPIFLLNELNKIKFCSFHLKYYIFSEIFQIVLIVFTKQNIHLFSQDVFPIKKEARSRASPPAAGRFCDKILCRRMAILAERFYVIGSNFL